MLSCPSCLDPSCLCFHGDCCRAWQGKWNRQRSAHGASTNHTATLERAFGLRSCNKMQCIRFNSENLFSHFSVYCVISSWFSLWVHQLDIKDQCQHWYWAYQVSPMRWRSNRKKSVLTTTVHQLRKRVSLLMKHYWLLWQQWLQIKMKPWVKWHKIGVGMQRQHVLRLHCLTLQDFLPGFSVAK